MISNILKISKRNIENHLRQFNHVSHFDVRLPHWLNEKPYWIIFPYMAENIVFKKWIQHGMQEIKECVK